MHTFIWTISIKKIKVDFTNLQHILLFIIIF